ncbi:MAG: hypothetical protein WDO56_22880 [Gammaproteobacteria bacterium]
MTDPLRPFADMIRSLWLARLQAKGATQASSKGKTGAEAPAPRPGRSFRSQLKARVSASRAAGPARMREAFVEAVLLWELGEQLAPDPAFGEMVTTVSEQIASDPMVGERLHRALQRLAEEPRT